MKKQILVVMLSLFIAHAILGQNNYNVDFISDSITKNADAVIRFHKTSYKIFSSEKYITDVHYAITILNPNGKHFAELVVYYDKDTRVSDIKGFIYNKKGELQGKLKKENIKDYVANGNYTLYSDNRAKYFSPAVSTYPFTIEYKYTIEKSGIVGFDTWMPQKWFNVSVESAELSISSSDGSDFKYMELNHDFIKNSSDTENSIIYSWEVKNLKAVEFEPHAPNFIDFMPAVLLSPNKIIYERTEGDFSTWENYGKWVYNLINNRDELSEETVRYIHNLTDSIDNKIDKIRTIYKYMQSKTRYVNVVLGLGGFQPIIAKEVDAKGYGDCKALSNYTKALLKCVGITSFYAEIGAGEYQEIKFTDFASTNQTNHIILCVPLDTDTVWLECTNQNIPFGFLMPSCQNRYALLIKPNGGELVKTPSFNANANKRISRVNLNFNKIGDVDFEITTDYYNSLYSEIFPLLNASPKEQKEYLLKDLFSSKVVDITKIIISENSKESAQAKLYIEGKINNFASTAGPRMFFSPELFHNNDFLGFISSERKLDVFEPISYSYFDTLRISFPAGYALDYMQNSMQFNSVYGRCEFNVDKIDDKITIIRELSINGGNYNYSRFGEINEFLRSISDYQSKKIIITNE